MDQSLKARWLSALRDGKYLQGRGALRRSNGQDKFCCLGVLQDIMAPEDWAEPNAGNHEKDWAANGCTGGLTDEMHDLAGLDLDETRALVDLNDGDMCSESPDGTPEYSYGCEPKSFEFIANHIEENM